MIAPILRYFFWHQMVFRVFYLLFLPVSVCTIMLEKSTIGFGVGAFIRLKLIRWLGFSFKIIPLSGLALLM